MTAPLARLRGHWLAWSICAALAGLLGWAAFAPVQFPTREEVFEIPKGTFARRMRGDPVEILPSEIHLTLGVRDVLLLRNLDEVPQVFGPTLMMPGQSFSLPFELASEYQFACTAHASGQMTVVVHPRPDSPWQRLRWRAHRLWESFGRSWAGSSPSQRVAEGALDAKYARKSKQGRKGSKSRLPDRPIAVRSTLRPLRPTLSLIAEAHA